MKPNGAGNLSAIEKTVHGVVRFLGWCSGIALMVMILILCGDVLGRLLLNRPFSGSFELSELSMLVLTFCAIAYTEMSGGHVDIGLLVSRWTERRQVVTGIATSTVAALFWAMVAWQLSRQGWLDFAKGASSDMTMVLRIPTAPFYFLAALGSVFLCLEIALGVRHKIRQLHGR